ncbi:helix-turn-helix domain-containing protein [Limnochorda pilosa]|uniref:DNA-binding protein n=1 Tax=Limnochorda pilosa TaxID=1555112 RepID=A0A0K2SIR1_LIMPI|nr:helix-turn-helix domain-containing protein [Limnochorda pilosa]BAS26709.1 DNA-binding protein [Limnochorda pilosa]
MVATTRGAGRGEKQQLQRLRELLATAATRGATARLSSDDVEGVEVPRVLLQLMARGAELLAGGYRAAVVEVEKSLTTQQAANILGISRPQLIRLLEGGSIPFHKIGSHRRVRVHDLLRYRDQLMKTRRRSLARITGMSEDLGLYHD